MTNRDKSMEIIMKMIICLRSGKKEMMGIYIKLNTSNLKTISQKDRQITITRTTISKTFKILISTGSMESSMEIGKKNKRAIIRANRIIIKIEFIKNIEEDIINLKYKLI